MYKRQHQAMTLIEILIAISVFAVGVLSVLQLVTNNIRTTDHVSKHMDATMLATQWLELMYEMRNTNSYKEVEWDCYDLSIQTNEVKCNGRLSTLHNNQAIAIAPVWPENNKYWSVEVKSLGNNNIDTFRLYRHVSDANITYFDHVSDNGTETPYARYITVENIQDYEPKVALKITSHVLVEQWGKEPKEVSISSIIGNIIE